MEEGGDIFGIELKLDTTGLVVRKRQSIHVWELGKKENISKEKQTPKTSIYVGPKRLQERGRSIIDNDNTELSSRFYVKGYQRYCDPKSNSSCWL